MDYSTDHLNSFAVDLGPRLEKMNFKQKLYFILSCIERTLPFYMHYGRVSNFNNLDELSATVESYWGLSDFPAGALKKAEISQDWEKTDKHVGYICGQVINLLMDYLNLHDDRIIMHISDKMILLGEVLTIKLGDNHVGEELELQWTAIGDAEALDVDDLEALNDYITRSIQIASNLSSDILVNLT